MSTRIESGKMELFKVVTSKGKVFENVRAEDIIFSHKIGKIRGGSKIQDGAGKWHRVEDFVKARVASGNLDKYKKDVSGGFSSVGSVEIGGGFSRGNAKVLELLAGKAGSGKNTNSSRNHKKYFFLDGRMFLLATICLVSILLNVILVFYNDLVAKKDGEYNVGSKEFGFEMKAPKNKKTLTVKAKIEKKKTEEMELIAKKSEGYYRNIDEKAFEDEKGKILQYERQRLGK